MDIRDELDAAFGEGPAHLPVEERVRAGRRALRRRRVATAAGALGVVVVVGLTGAATIGVADDRGDRPTYTSTQDPVDDYLDEVPVGLEPVSECPTGSWEREEGGASCQPDLVGYDEDGHLVRADGVTVTRLVLDPVLRDEAQKSAALEVRHDGKRWWVYLTWMPGGSSYGPEPAGDDFDAWVARGVARDFGGISSGERVEEIGDLRWWDPASGKPVTPDGVRVIRRVENPMALEAPHDSVALIVEWHDTVYWLLTDLTLTEGSGGSFVGSERADDSTYDDFGEWLAEQLAVQRVSPPLDLVEFAPDGTLHARPGKTILEQRANPDLPASYGPPGMLTVVAKVSDGERTWFVLARKPADGDADYVETPVELGGSTFAEFLAYAAREDVAHRYALDGEGRR